MNKVFLLENVYLSKSKWIKINVILGLKLKLTKIEKKKKMKIYLSELVIKINFKKCVAFRENYYFLLLNFSNPMSFSSRLLFV